MEKAFDRRQLKYLDFHLRSVVDTKYNLCHTDCFNDFKNDISLCKENCVRQIIVPYRYQNHMAKEDEEILYKKCIADKLPNV